MATSTNSKIKTKKPTKPEPTFNGFAIAGFVTSFFFAIVGFVLSLVGLNQINKDGDKGKGLAVAGIVISSVSIFFTIIVVIFAGLFSLRLLNDRHNEFDRFDDIKCNYSFEYVDGEFKSDHNCE